MIWHEHGSSIATAAGKKLGYLFKARKHFSPSNLLTLYKAQIGPSLEYCSHIWGAAPLLPYLYLMQSREGQFDSSVTRPLLATSSRFPTDVLLGPLTLLPLFKRILLLLLLTPRRSFFIHQEPNDTTAPLSPGCPGPGMDCLVMYLLSRRVLAYSSLASTDFP
nr:unnamed protein product [Callosobruchus chinensis]